MDYLYELLDSEDLFRIPRDIKSRFAKLTLSKKKEIRKSISENRSEINQVLGRNIIEDLLSDDSSEGEADAINRIFLSKSKESDEKKSMNSGNTIVVSSDTENINKLVLNDTDLTHCSIYEKNNNGRPVEIVSSVIGMERLQVTENIVLTNSEKIINSSEIDKLSQKVSDLNIKSPKKLLLPIADDDTVLNTEIISINSLRKSEIINANLNIKNEENKSILTISSGNTTPAKKLETQCDSDLSGSEEDIIVITDTDDEEEHHNAEYEQHVSDLHQSGQTNLCSTLSNTRADRVEAFLHDLEKIPQEDLDEENHTEKSNQQYDEEKDIVSTKSDESIPTDSIPNDSIPSDSIEIAETSTEQDQEIFVNELEKDEKLPIIDQESPTLEDNSPLIQTEKSSVKKSSSSPLPSNNISDSSSDCDQQISISAKFNIKIQFSQPKIIVENHDSCESNESIEIDSKPSQQSTSSSKTRTKTTSSSNSNRESEHYQENQKMTTPNKMVEKIIAPISDNNDALLLDEVDDQAKEILTKLYGNAWKTPEIIKKLDRKTNSPANSPGVQKSSGKKKNQTINKFNEKTKSPVNQTRTGDDTTIADFSMFHKNIRCDLESTRLKSPVKSTINSKRPQTDRKPKIEKNVEKKCQTVKATGRHIKRTNYRRILKSSDSSDDDSNDDKCFGSSSDDNFITHSSSSSSSSNEGFKKPIRKQRQKKNELIYMDLSMDEVKIVDETKRSTPEKRPDSNDKLEYILKSCTFDDKKKIPATPKNTKRKLFTPQFATEEEIILYNSPIRQQFNESNEVQLRIPLPAMFALPINKQLESVKTGTPIFKLPTPTSTKKTPKSIKNKENTNDITPSVTSKTPSSLNRIKKALANEFLDDNQLKTYGFLQSLDVCLPKTVCHPDALIYREKFRQNKDELCDKLYKLFNEKVFDNKLNVSIIWNKKLQNTAGRCCNRKRGNKRSSTVELSEKVLTSADRLRCTLIHELCHAATWIFSGEGGHGATWKGWAKKSNSVFPELPVIGVCHDYDIEYKYTYKCTVCLAKSNAHSRSKKVENIRCSFCHGTIEIFINKKNKEGVIVSTPVKAATGFAKFVKEKYKFYKRPDINHGEVMKLLGAEFAGLSVEEKSKF